MSETNNPPGGAGGTYGGGYGTGPTGPGGPGGSSGPGGPGGPQYGPSGASGDAKGFIGSLFDFSFNSFVTPKIVRFVYILLTIAIVLGYVGFVIAGFADSAVSGVLVLLLGWIPALLYLALFRMTLEFYYSVVRMSEDINRRLPAGR